MALIYVNVNAKLYEHDKLRPGTSMHFNGVNISIRDKMFTICSLGQETSYS